jgi:hypothetical protein
VTTQLKPPTHLTGRVSDSEYASVYDEFLADTPADLYWPNSVQAYASMRRDPTCAAILSGYGLQVLRATWQLDGRGCKPTVTKLVADDMDLPVVDKDTQHGAARTRGVSWPEYLRATINSRLTFGHYGAELGADTSTGKARLVVLAERPANTVTEIHADPKSGEFLGITQDQARRDGTPQIPARNMVWHSREREGIAWQGVSLLKPMWASWWLKREMIRVNATSNRRWGAGVPTMEPKPGTNPTGAQVEAAQRLVSAARAGETAGAVLPGWDMKILGMSGAVPDTLGFIEWLDRQMSRAALMPHLELGQGTTGGSRALGEAFVDSWLLALESEALAIASEATRQIAARIVEWNFGPDEPVPSVVVSGIGSRREVTATALQSLLSAGALSVDPALEDWVRREYHLPERDDQKGPTRRLTEYDLQYGLATKNEARANLGLPPDDGPDGDKPPQPIAGDAGKPLTGPQGGGAATATPGGNLDWGLFGGAQTAADTTAPDVGVTPPPDGTAAA